MLKITGTIVAGLGVLGLVAALAMAQPEKQRTQAQDGSCLVDGTCPLRGGQNGQGGGDRVQERRRARDGSCVADDEGTTDAPARDRACDRDRKRDGACDGEGQRGQGRGHGGKGRGNRNGQQ